MMVWTGLVVPARGGEWCPLRGFTDAYAAARRYGPLVMCPNGIGAFVPTDLDAVLDMYRYARSVEQRFITLEDAIEAFRASLAHDQHPGRYLGSFSRNHVLAALDRALSIAEPGE